MKVLFNFKVLMTEAI